MKSNTHPVISARRAGVPLIAYETSDPAQSIYSIINSLNGKKDTVAILEWDVIKGLTGINRKGSELVTSLTQSDGQPATVQPAYTLNLLQGVSLKQQELHEAVCFFKNGHRFINDDQVSQALWNLRDTWKAFGAILVLLCPSIKLPDELAHDIVVLTEPLPDAEEVGKIVDEIASSAGLETVEHRERVIDTLLGVSAFAAEQALAMSITAKDGSKKVSIDRDELWERKRKMVEQTPGLSVFRGGETFDSIGGLSNIKDFLTKILTSGRNPVRCIGFIDEIEKMFAGAGGDLSGISQDQLKIFLTEMQDNNIPGMILIGPPGTGKSAIAKAAGAVSEAEVLTIDTGAMTGSLVGDSQAKIRKAMATFRAVSQGKGLFIATCNRIASLPPELRRRFTLGTFFVNLPSDEERASIWPIWLKKYQMDVNEKRPDDSNWTGAEIRACCDVAFRANIPLQEAAKFIVPVSISAADQIDALRKMASGKFISASTPGLYKYEESAPVIAAAPRGRKFGGN